MRAHILCRERLVRILRILKRHPEGLSVREFARTFGVLAWEVEQAAELGWLAIETRKPHTGRPARVAVSVNISKPAKLPPLFCDIEKRISFRHQHFALHSVFPGDGQAIAYRQAFPKAHSMKGVAASASRLLRHKDVMAVRAWAFARMRRDVPDEPMPPTRGRIIQRLNQCRHSRTSVGWP